MEKNIENTVGQLQGMATTTTSLAKSTNQVWPFVVVSDFERRTRAVSLLAAASMVILSPVVSISEHDEWNAFSREHHDWTAAVSNWDNINSR